MRISEKRYDRVDPVVLTKLGWNHCGMTKESEESFFLEYINCYESSSNNDDNNDDENNNNNNSKCRVKFRSLEIM